MRSSMRNEFLVERRCLVCEFVERVTEPALTDQIGPPCSRCRAPTERTRVLARRTAGSGNPHATALGRLGGLKGGPARAAALSARRRTQIAREAARARWKRKKSS